MVITITLPGLLIISAIEIDRGFQACILTLQSNRPLGVGLDSRLQFLNYFTSYDKRGAGVSHKPRNDVLKNKIDLSVIPEALMDGAKCIPGGLLVFL